MRSKTSGELDHLERDLPTTTEDIEALRRIRATAFEDTAELLRALEKASSLLCQQLPRRRTTSKGWEPFTL